MFAVLKTSFHVFAQAAGEAAPAAVEAATEAAGATPPPANPLIQLLPFILLFVGFWFLFLRPQQKRQKEIQKRQTELKVGDKVVTTSGIPGKVVSIKDDIVNIQVNDGVRIPFQRSAIVVFESDNDTAEKKDDSEGKK